MTPVNANQAEYKSTVGLSDLFVALVTKDDASGYTAETPEYLAPAAEASQEPTTSLDIQYADDQPFDVLSSESDTKINLSVTGMPPEMEAKILGKTFDAASGRLIDDGGTPPDVALSFRAQKANGKYIYYQYLKGKFSAPKEETATVAEKKEPKLLQLQFTGIRTIYKFDLGSGKLRTVKRIKLDEDTTNANPAGWFLQVQVPGATAPAALALSSSVPANNGTGVAVAANLTLTFNNALRNEAVNNITLINATTGAVIASTVTLDPAKKVATIDPTSNLSAATQHRIIIAGVVDVYGQKLTTVVNFTTA